MGESITKSEKLNIFGDFYLSPDDNLDVFSEIKKHLFESKFNIVNFEGPIVNKGKIVVKTGPNLKQHPNSVDVLLKSNIKNLCLSNNHILDYGESNLDNSVKIFKENNLQFYGLLNQGNKSLSLDGIEIGIINVSEHEWQSHYSSNVQYEDTVDTSNLILEMKHINDFNILIYHGGLEHQTYPSLKLLEKLTLYIKLGVDLICVHHSHCISGVKEIDGKKIYFGLGNFYFSDFSKKNQHSNTGIGVNVSVKNNELHSEHFFIEKKRNKVQILKENDTTLKKLKIDFKTISENLNNKISFRLKNEIIHKKVYQNYINYINPFYRPNRFFKSLNRFIPKSKIRLIYNLIRNDTHREMLIISLKKYLNK